MRRQRLRMEDQVSKLMYLEVKLNLCNSAHINCLSIIRNHPDDKAIVHFLTIEHVAFTKAK